VAKRRDTCRSHQAAAATKAQAAVAPKKATATLVGTTNQIMAQNAASPKLPRAAPAASKHLARAVRPLLCAGRASSCRKQTDRRVPIVSA